jgi:hypothetical protein
MPNGSSQLGDIFVTSDDDRVTGDYLVRQFSSLIDKLGSAEYIGCVFDGEQAYQNAGKKLQEMFPWSIHLTCFAHSLNLILKDISVTSSFKEVFANAHKMVALCNVRECRAELNTLQLSQYGKQLPIRLGVETRFAFMIREVEDLIASKDAIKSLKDKRSLREKFAGKNTSTQDQRDAFATIDDPQFWTALKTISEFLSPISEMIHYVEQDTALISQTFFIRRFLHHTFRLEGLKSHRIAMLAPEHETPRRLLHTWEEEMAEQVDKRFSSKSNSSSNPLGAISTLAFLLDFRFYKHQATVASFRLVPNIDKEIVSHEERIKARETLENLAPAGSKQYVVEEFDRLLLEGISDLPEEDLLPLLDMTLEIPGVAEWKIKTKDGMTDSGNYHVGVLWKKLSTLPDWKFPLLAQHVCPNLFSLHITSCSTERVWSRMRYLYRPQRNKLSPVKAKKILLVSIAHTFEENMSKKQKLLPQEEMEEGASDPEDDDSLHPDIFLEGVDLDALDEDFFDLRDCLENDEGQHGQREPLTVDESVAVD